MLIKIFYISVVSTNNNYDDEDGGLKIDEDADPGKENLDNKMEDDIAEVDHSNGVSEEEEEPSMPGPGGELADAASKELSFSFPYTKLGSLKLYTYSLGDPN